MILESLIKDGSKITLDCAKATLSKGSVVEISDAFWHNAEVKGAIKLGFVKVVGDIPTISDPELIAATEEKKIKYQSTAKTKLAFECVKDYVEPGGCIWIPESKTYCTEVQNALSWGLIKDPNATEQHEEPYVADPVQLDEVSIVDEPQVKVSKPKPKQEFAKARPAPAKNSPIKAKKISSSHEDVSDGNEDGPNELTSESKVHVPKDEDIMAVRKPVRQMPKEDIVESTVKTSEIDFDFDSIFGKK